jgi:hypothetical protein
MAAAARRGRLMFDRAALAAAIVVDASEAEVAALVAATRRPDLADLPLWSALERVETPPEGSTTAELAAWASVQLQRHRDVVALGALIGTVVETYLVRGWAVAAATAAAGDAAAMLPPFDDLVARVADRARTRFIAETADDVATRPPERDAMIELGCAPPGGDIVRGALATAIEAIGNSAPIDGPTAVARLDASLDVAAQMLELPTAPRSDATAVVELGPVIACLHDAGDSEWTWQAIADWETADPLVFAKAVARGLGVATLVPTFEAMRDKLAGALAWLVEAAWRTEVAAARRAALDEPPDPLAEAIVELATKASVLAARRLATAALARWDGTRGEDLRELCAELLGDPRDCPVLWEASVPAIRAALEAISRSSRRSRAPAMSAPCPRCASSSRMTRSRCACSRRSASRAPATTIHRPSRRGSEPRVTSACTPCSPRVPPGS